MKEFFKAYLINFILFFITILILKLINHFDLVCFIVSLIITTLCCCNQFYSISRGSLWKK